MSWSPPEDKLEEWTPPVTASTESWTPPTDDAPRGDFSFLSLANKDRTASDYIPQELKDAYGLGEAGVAMAASLPNMGEAYLRKLYSHATSTGTAEENKKAAEEAAQDSYFQPHHPLTDAGKKAEELLGLIPTAIIKGSGEIGSEFSRGATFYNDPTLKTTGDVVPKYGTEAMDTSRNVGEMLAEGVMLAGVGEMGYKAAKKAKEMYSEKQMASKVAEDWVPPTEGGMSMGEFKELAETHRRTEESVANLTETQQRLEAFAEQMGEDLPPELRVAMEENRAKLEHTTRGLEDLEARMTGDITDQVGVEKSVARDAEVTALRERLKEKKAQREAVEEIT